MVAREYVLARGVGRNNRFKPRNMDEFNPPTDEGEAGGILAGEGFNNVGTLKVRAELSGEAAFGGKIANHDRIPNGQVGVNGLSCSGPADGPGLTGDDDG